MPGVTCSEAAGLGKTDPGLLTRNSREELGASCNEGLQNIIEARCTGRDLSWG